MRIVDSNIPRNREVESVANVRASIPRTSHNWTSAKSDEFLEFIDNNPTVYHVTDYFAKKLLAGGFRRLSERESWNGQIRPGNKYFTTRNDSSIIAFEIGKDWRPGKGIGLVGTHIDSSVLKLKPISKKNPIEGYRLLGVSLYGGPIETALMDRDLSLGGRVIVRNRYGVIETKLVHIPYPIARIPSLAPHFGTIPDAFNPETRLVPVIGLVEDGEVEAITEDEKKCPIIDRHDIELLRTVADNAGVPLSSILQLDLRLFDSQTSVYGGLKKEFIFSSRLDDKLCSFTAMNALIESGGKSPDTISLCISFDSEEIGSGTVAGAQSDLFDSTIDRVIGSFPFTNFNDARRLTLANSIFLSADVSHAVNPNYADIYLEHHRPKLNVGLVIASSPAGKLATEPSITAVIEELARQSGDKLQYFQIRNGTREGGSIGPLFSTKTGIRGIDIGHCLLSMHSIREAAGSKDIDLGIKFFSSFYSRWLEVDGKFAHK